jgi:hypothetical protein
VTVGSVGDRGGGGFVGELGGRPSGRAPESVPGPTRLPLALPRGASPGGPAPSGGQAPRGGAGGRQRGPSGRTGGCGRAEAERKLKSERDYLFPTAGVVRARVRRGPARGLGETERHGHLGRASLGRAGTGRARSESWPGFLSAPGLDPNPRNDGRG